jgi:hypothetical protein
VDAAGSIETLALVSSELHVTSQKTVMLILNSTGILNTVTLQSELDHYTVRPTRG